MLLARKGYRVLLVDRATFPSDSMRLHYIHQSGVARLKRWGLLDRLIATNCPPIRQRIIDYDDFPLAGGVTPLDGVADAYAPRRFVLDALLVEAATESGAELRERFSVDALEWDDGRVVGIRGRSAGGAPVSERARIVVGADGMHSTVARMVGAATYREGPPLACYYASYWSGVPTLGLEIYWRDERMIFVFPTNDDRTSVAVGWPRGMFHQVRADVEGQVEAALELVPELASRVRAGRREEPFIGTADLPSFFRTPHGPGWALVGDAGYHKDPYLAQGISDAFRDADLLSDAIDGGLSGRLPLDAALGEYERRRNDEVLPIYELNCRLATLEPLSTQQLGLRAALRGNREATEQFFGVNAGTVPYHQFFAPDNIARIMSQAAVTATG
jgi:flavin-dependent dehydrogenase